MLNLNNLQNTEKKYEQFVRYIGLNRKLLNIQLDPFLQEEKSNELENEDNIEQNTLQNPNPNDYSGFIVYDENENYKKNSLIDIKVLYSILSYDEKINEVDINKSKGEWKDFFENTYTDELELKSKKMINLHVCLIKFKI